MSVVTDGPRVRLRTHADVRGYVERVCFKTGPPGLVGTEIELIMVSTEDPTRPVPIPLLRSLLDAAGPLPHRSSLTYEPGGQLELSSRAFPGTTACWQALAEDLAHARRVLGAAGLVPLPTALDPFRPPQRQLRQPRYDAMGAYFEAIGSPTGDAMMNSTAALQVNLDIGSDHAEAARRWRLLHAIGPTMVAVFANSPVHAGRDTGWRCGRQRIWQHLDPCRSGVPVGEDPVTAWTDFALDARVMLQRRDDGDCSVPEHRSFRDWMRAEAERPPRVGDLELHLTTLFPPVRPRGWFEVRYVDAQAEEWWPVPMAVLAALVEDPVAGATAEEACRGVDDWAAAAREGYAAPGVRQAAAACLDAALQAMRRAEEDKRLLDLVTDYAAHYVSRGRSPADDPIPEVL